MHHLYFENPKVLVVSDPGTSPILATLHDVKIKVSLSDLLRGWRDWHSLPGVMKRLSFESNSLMCSLK